jgi:hypothetical protein
MERIDKLQYTTSVSSTVAEGRATNLFYTGPAEFLCREVAAYFGATNPWTILFGEYVDGYKRMDYPQRALPAMRIYNTSFTKSFDSWFIEGDIICDVMFPPNLRRQETQQLPDTVCAAILQQFRDPNFFLAICDKVPGLNELGKTVSVDKGLAFDWNDDLAPLTEITLNFRIDLRQWDEYLESDNRTKSSPFERTLEDLQQIAVTIKALREQDLYDSEAVTVQLDVNTTGE